MSAPWHRRSTARTQIHGNWSFEIRGDELADLRYQDALVVRSIRAVVRDRDWNTARWTIEAETVTDDGVSLILRCDDLGLAAHAVLRVTVRADELTVSFDCEALRPMWTNRTGLVVLHPPTLAGDEVHVVHASGGEEPAVFPVAVSPHQPVLDIAALQWMHDGLKVSAEFTGDTFEMEDQRNWTDASFKTYSRQLDLPFPYLLAAGERVRQSIVLRATRVAAAPMRHDSEPITLKPAGAFPIMQVGASTAPDPRPVKARRVGDVRLVELDLGSSNWQAAWHRAKADGMPLDVRCVFGAEDVDALDRLATELRGASVRRIAAFDRASHVSNAAVTAMLRAVLRRHAVVAEVVGGARSHFTELNREWGALPADLDGIVFATTPLFHSLDTEQLIEAVAMQRLLAEQAVALAGGRPVHVGPVTLRPRFNNVATAPPPMPTTTDLSEGYGAEFTGSADERHSAAEFAAWTIASAAALAVPGVESITWFEEWGDRGIYGPDGERRPVVGAIEALTRLGGTELLWGPSPDGLVWAIAARRASSIQILLANLDTRPRSIAVRWLGERAEAVVAPLAWTTVRRKAQEPGPADDSFS